MSRWIQDALDIRPRRVRGRIVVRAKRPGALRRQLKIPAGKKIPLGLLQWAAKQPGLLGRRARLALMLRKF